MGVTERDRKWEREGEKVGEREGKSEIKRNKVRSERN